MCVAFEMSSACLHEQCLVILLKCEFLCRWSLLHIREVVLNMQWTWSLFFYHRLCSRPVESAAWDWLLIRRTKAHISCLVKLFCE